MEPQHNKQLALRKAISAHQEAEASLTDLVQDSSDTTYSNMLQRVRDNLRELHAAAASGEPEDLI
jgi:hypothetical protein